MATNWIVEAITSAVSETGTKTANLANGSNFNIHDSTDDTQIFRILNDSSDYYSMTLYGHDGQPAKFYMAADNGTTQADAWLWQVADGGNMSWKARSSGTVDPQGDIYANTTMSLDTSGNLTTLGTLDVGGASVNLGANSYMTLTEQQIDVSNGDLTIDVAGNIILFTDGGDFSVKDEGSNVQTMKVSHDNYSQAVGGYAGNAIASALYSTAIGYEALKTEDGALGNVAVGHQAMKFSNSDGADYNVAVGYEAMENCTAPGAQNVAIGYETLMDADFTGSWQIAIGGQALTALTTGDYNTAIGRYALSSLVSNHNNTAIGYGALKAQTHSSNTALGYLAGNVTVGGDGNTIVGANAFGLNTAASLQNVIIGRSAMAGTVGNVNDYNVAIGAHAMDSTGVESTGSVVIGYNAGGAAAFTANYITAIGYQSGYDNTSGGSVFLGFQAGYNNTTGTENTFVGYNAGRGHDSVALTGGSNTVIGSNAGLDLQGDAHDNVLIGKSSGANIVTNAYYNIAIGNDALTNNDDAPVGNIVIGHEAMKDSSNACLHNIAIGYEAMENVTAPGNYNIALGYQALDTDGVTSSNLIAIGSDAMGNGAVDTGSAQIAIGQNALQNLSDGTTNVAMGYNAGLSLTTGSANTIVGYEGGDALTIGQYNVVMGGGALGAAVEDSSNVAIGQSALGAQNAGGSDVSATSTNNTAVGYQAGLYNELGKNNTFIGGQAGIGITGDKLDGDVNTCIGYRAGYELEGVAHSNTFIGALAGNTTEAGVENTCIGYNTEAEDDTATNQVVIGNNIVGAADNAVHIGNDTNHIAAPFNSGDGSWSYTSDRRQKKDIEDDILGLDFIKDLKTRTYKHKSPSEFPKAWKAYDADDKEPMGGDKIIHGFIAQEVKEALDKADVGTFQGWDEGKDGRQRLSLGSFVMPLIKAVQELSVQVEELKSKLGE